MQAESEFSSEANSVVRLVERHAQQQGGKVAARFQQQSISYGELNANANHLAHLLLALDLKKGERVVVCIPPGLEILIAILAVHKTGVVYVPLDPNFPTQRIQAILEEVQPRLILGVAETAFLEGGSSCPFVNLKQVLTAGAITKDNNPGITVASHDASHIFFTSGTTGKPKGVVASHGNLVHYIKSAVERFEFSASERFLSAARFTFSISLFELLTPLAVGAEVTLLAREQVLDLAQLSEAVQRATAFHFGPGLLKQLLPYIETHYPSFAAFRHLRHVSSGGDMVPVDILEKMKRIFTHADVFVIYGSSEISCMGCAYHAPRTRTIGRTKVGTAFKNVGVKILDEQLRPVADGAAGQLFFSGDGLVLGYLNQPELTSQKFFEIEGIRHYAIGDVGRVTEDGNIELLGRVDFQVQIRGMRVEVLEIEQHLKSLPQIADCVVVAKKLTEDADQVLVAYLVLRDGQTVNPINLSYHLRQFLPDYMVPARYVHLSELPLNHNGKLDRRQLPEPNNTNLLLSSQFRAAVSDVEVGLLQILEKLFGVDGIGVDHDFFELGGDSLAAVQYLMAVDKKFGRFIPITYLLEHPTVRELASLIEEETPVAGVGDVVVLKHGNTEAPLFCLYGVLLYRDLALTLDTQRTVCGVYLAEEMLLLRPDSGNLSAGVHAGRSGPPVAALRDLLSVDRIAARYLQSITAYQAHGPYYLAGESFGGIIALEVARLLRARGEPVALVAMLDSHAPGYWSSLSPAQKMLLHMKKILRERGAYFNRELIRKIKNRWLQKSGLTLVVDKRADARAIASRSYRPQTFSHPVVLFKARERTEFERETADLGWRPYLPNLTIHEVAGDHLGMLQMGVVQDLAEQMRRYL